MGEGDGGLGLSEKTETRLVPGPDVDCRPGTRREPRREGVPLDPRPALPRLLQGPL